MFFFKVVVVNGLQIWLSEKNTADDWTGESGVVHWDEVMYGKETLKARNEISDHRPVWATFYTYKGFSFNNIMSSVLFLHFICRH